MAIGDGDGVSGTWQVCCIISVTYSFGCPAGLTADCLTLRLLLLLRGRRSLNQPASECVGMRGQKKELRKRTRGCKDMAIGDGDGVSGRQVCCIISVTYSFGCPGPHWVTADCLPLRLRLLLRGRRSLNQPASERVGMRGQKKNSDNGRGAQKIWPWATATGIYYLDGRCVASFS
jgi:hypothetical protein